ncbi:hypothetical protein [Desulfobotulus mexicanus]|uniref:Uncharacterized protein n=1 Tax=Desulfobotulus mexicanus TaxID=2586642 RepID=A0A5S5MC25_9BACT|nr:hypothetical protein [Desulfobotulus mexicanus]TYT73262.1 hypothetical protein FIM25_16110 [Desulfobotulus mexicanus]
MIHYTTQIPPLFFGTAHHLLASRNPPVILPPLRSALHIHAGAFSAEALIHGDFSDEKERLNIEALHFSAVADFKEIIWNWQGQTEAGHLSAMALLRLPLVLAAFVHGADAFTAEGLLHPPAMVLTLTDTRFSASADLREPVIPAENEEILILKPFDARSRIRSLPLREIWWQKEMPVTSQKIYTCTIKDDAGSLPELELPMSSMQYRLQENGHSYMAVVVPDAMAFSTGILARIPGRLILRQGFVHQDATRQLTEMASAGRVAFRWDMGGRNSSATLTAAGKITFSFDPNVPKVLDPLISMSLQADGKMRFRSAPVMGLFPGDTVQAAGGAYRVARIAVAVGRNQATMEVLTE